MSVIEAGLGLKRNHLIAPSLLAENDHDLNGVQWLDTTLCFGQTFSEDEINRLGEIGSCDASVFQGIPTAKELISSLPVNSLATQLVTAT